MTAGTRPRRSRPPYARPSVGASTGRHSESPNPFNCSPRREQAPRPASNHPLRSPPELPAPRRRNHSSQHRHPREPRQSIRPQCSRRLGADRDIIRLHRTDPISLAAGPEQLSRQDTGQHQDHRGATSLPRNMLETTTEVELRRPCKPRPRAKTLLARPESSPPPTASGRRGTTFPVRSPAPGRQQSTFAFTSTETSPAFT